MFPIIGPISIFFSNSEKVCLKINGQNICSNDDNQSDDFQITDDTIKFNGVLDGVSSFEMVVDNENGGIQMSNVIVLHTGILIKNFTFRGAFEYDRWVR